MITIKAVNIQVFRLLILRLIPTDSAMYCHTRFPVNENQVHWF